MKTSMMLEFLAKIKIYLLFFTCLVFCGFVAFFKLGDSGLIDGHETVRAELVSNLSSGKRLELFPLVLEERLASFATKKFEYSEFYLRLPGAFLGIIAVALVYIMLLPLLGVWSSAFAALIFICSPYFIFHGKHLTSAMPSIIAEIAVFGGALQAIVSESKYKRILGLALSFLGVFVGTASRGMLVGAAAPLAAVFAGAVSCNLLFNSAKTVNLKRAIIILTLGTLAVLAAGIFIGFVAFSENDYALVTGGALKVQVQRVHSFEFAFEQIVYAWFPLCALIPAAVFNLFSPQNKESDVSHLVRTVAVYGLLFEYAAQAIALDISGMNFALCSWPMIVLLVLSIQDLLNAKITRRFEVFVSITILLILIRDFAQNKNVLLYGFGFEGLSITNENVKLVVQSGLFAIPTALLIVLGFFPLRWRKNIVQVFFKIAAPVSIAIFTMFFLLPNTYRQLSNEVVMDVVNQFRNSGEPIAVWGEEIGIKDSKKVNSAEAAAEWLSVEERVFAVLPYNELGAVDKALRDKTGEHLFVLKKEKDQFVFAVSRSELGEKNANQLVNIVSSTPFSPEPSNPLNVNFNNSFTLRGWELTGQDGNSEVLKRGEKFIFTSYWHVNRPIGEDYKMFMHFDGPQKRMSGDHDFFGGEYPTSSWLKEDFIKEVFTTTVPDEQAAGLYTLRIGLYNAKGRMAVLNESDAAQNSLFIAEIVIE